MADDSIKYTAFITPVGVYEFTRMPFGLKVGPSRFQRFVNEALSGLIRFGDVIVYIDDILVATSTLEQDLSVLKQLFKVPIDNLLELRVDKCKFLYTEIDFLGYIVSEQGIQPTRAGIEAVTRFPIPQNIHSVQSFLRLCSYFRKFIDGFALIAKPLYDLVKKKCSVISEKHS